MSNNFGSKRNLFRIVAILILALLLVGAFTDWIIEWLWLGNLGYSQVFWTIKATQAILLVCSLAVALLYVLPNMHFLSKRFANMNFGQSPLSQLNLHEINAKTFRNFFYIVGSAVSVFFSLAFFMQWDKYFRFHWNETIGKLDPVFGHDIGFYLFRLPFIELIQNSLVSLAFFVTIAMIILYIYSGALSLGSNKKINAISAVKKQISINVGIWLLLLSWGYFLERYSLLYNKNGVVYGADYVDIHIKLPVIWILCILCLLLALFAFSQIYKSRFKWLVIGGIATFVVGALGSGVLPSLVQNYVVEPNELQLEKPYLKNNISMTRSAYNLDKFHVRNYNASDTLTWPKISNNQATLDNIRLWDPRLLIQTYRQLQEIRTYYQFYNVDVDRYHTNDGYLQMMLSARELSDQLPEKANTWVNKKLQYTHGYGMVMSPVAKQGNQGDPQLVIKDLPPVSQMGLNINQSAIYYGEHNSDYKIVNTDVKELDYPQGDKNVYTNYAGSGGVSVDNFFKKLLFAWHFGDINILLSNYIHKGSKIMFWKTIKNRVRHIAPFLRLEDRPYLVLSNGKLYWIQDAYTVSPDYPYSEPARNGQYNYIRNSVKVVVDAYDGSVNFYTMKDNDPILSVYEDAFPNMFKSLDKMPSDLKKHLRYPEHLFSTQIDKYDTYHMTDPQVFYNNEDLWTRPTEKYGGQQIKMQPYYLLSKLPGEDQLQYLLINPVTPQNRDNMISWIAAKSDFPQYGEVSVFKLPKERLIYGPAQIEAKIDQDTDISQQLSLWDQRGSKIIRGNLMVVPLEDSFLYVEPVFLIAEGVEIPQLQRVIATDGDQISMAPTLQGAIRGVFNKKGQSLPVSAVPDTVVKKTTGPGLNQFRSLWQDASKALQNGKWEDFGKKMKQIEDMLNKNSDNQ
ncbi:MAG TPA: UPF0182 family protein [Balneolaceae bacterium]|nr:UPF0182 family protein [Balneolaceae bacterium]